MKVGEYNLPIKVNVLGTEYKIFYRTSETDLKLENNDGYCEIYKKEIVIDRKLFEPSDDPKLLDRLDIQGLKVIRHEIIHAFISESGLWENSEWARNEEMTDWIAKQFPKMYKVFSELNIADK